MPILQDSPTSKLLYNKEVQVYKTKVKKFYASVKEMPRIPEDAMQYFLRQLSEVNFPACLGIIMYVVFFLQYQTQQMKKTGGFVTESAVNELLRYATRYSEPVSQHIPIIMCMGIVKHVLGACDQH